MADLTDRHLREGEDKDVPVQADRGRDLSHQGVCLLGQYLPALHKVSRYCIKLYGAANY